MNKKQAYTEEYLEAHQLRFFSALPLDEAIKCLERLPPEYELKIITESADDCRFEMRYGNRRVADAAMGRGTLRRWEGTYTRVDCEGQVLNKKLRPKEAEPMSNFKALMIVFGSIFMVLIGLPVIFIISPVMGAILILAGLLVGWRFAYQQQPSVSPTQVMFNALKATFAKAGSIADTPDDLVHQLTPAHPEAIDGEIVMVEDVSPHRDEQ